MKPTAEDIKTHKLKTWVQFFQKVKSGEKSFELRKNDRSYKVGDILLLQEYDHLSGKYTGEEIKRKVSYVLDGGRFGLQGGYVIMGLKHYSQSNNPVMELKAGDSLDYLILNNPISKSLTHQDRLKLIVDILEAVQKDNPNFKPVMDEGRSEFEKAIDESLQINLIEDTWDKFSESIGAHIDDLERWAGKTVMDREQFIKSMKSTLPTLSPVMDERDIDNLINIEAYQRDFFEPEKELGFKIGAKWALSLPTSSTVISRDEIDKSNKIIEETLDFINNDIHRLSFGLKNIQKLLSKLTTQSSEEMITIPVSQLQGLLSEISAQDEEVKGKHYIIRECDVVNSFMTAIMREASEEDRVAIYDKLSRRIPSNEVKEDEELTCMCGAKINPHLCYDCESELDNQEPLFKNKEEE